MTWAPRLAVALLLFSACAVDVVSIGHDEPVKNQGVMPVGPVWACWGSDCPYGECDNGEDFSSTDCDDVYPGPVDDRALFCKPGVSADYCLELGSDEAITDYWIVHCGGGVASAEQCPAGCTANSDGSGHCL